MEPREGLPKAHPPPFRFYTQQPSTILLNTPILQPDNPQEQWMPLPTEPEVWLMIIPSNIIWFDDEMIGWD